MADAAALVQPQIEDVARLFLIDQKKNNRKQKKKQKAHVTFRASHSAVAVGRPGTNGRGSAGERCSR